MVNQRELAALCDLLAQRACHFADGGWTLQRLQVFDQVTFFPLGEKQPEVGVVVVHDIAQRSEAPVMIEAAFGVGPQSLQRCGAVAFVRCSIRLKIVDADLLRGMHVPTGLGISRRHMSKLRFGAFGAGIAS
jgi:hypothetical protein